MQYGAFRKPYKNREGMPHDPNDSRLLFYGVRYLVESYLMCKWTMDDVDKAANFYRCAKKGPQRRGPPPAATPRFKA